MLQAAEGVRADTMLVACFDLSASVHRDGLANRVIDGAELPAGATVGRWLLVFS